MTLLKLIGVALAALAFILGEVLIELAGEVLTEVIARLFILGLRQDPMVGPVVSFIAYVLLGGLFGCLSWLICPRHLLGSLDWQIANLVLSPIALGLVMMAVGKYLQLKGRLRLRIDQFSYGAAFAFALAVVRFALSRR